MKKTLLTSCLLALAAATTMQAQVMTSDPSPLQLSSENIKIYFHADQGKAELKGKSDIYAHTGVTIDGKQWQHVVAEWPDKDDKCKMTKVATDLWCLDIGNIKDYYGLEDWETPTQLNFVFHDQGSQIAQTKDDLFFDVLPDGYQVSIQTSLDGLIINSSNNNVGIKVMASAPSTLLLTVDGKTVATQTNATTLETTYKFLQQADYVLKATAINASTGEVVTAEKALCYAKASQSASYPGGEPQMGAVAQTDGTVTFCLAAPSKQTVMLVGAWNDYVPTNNQVMNYVDYQGYRYFWTNVEGLDPDRRYPYYYIVDGTYEVADPYGRLTLDPFNDGDLIEAGLVDEELSFPKDKVGMHPISVYHGNMNRYNWTVTDFKGVEPHQLMIYELLLRDFTGTEGEAKASGTLRAAMEKLDYLEALGINAIELMPIMEFEGNNSWGYNTNFYFSPDKAYGTPDDYKAFIDECHSRGIAVILDIVLNHSPGWHPWYAMYDAGRSPFYNATTPHAYGVYNDWRQEYPLVQRQWKDCLQYWLREYKVDGYRFDLVKGLGDSDSYKSGTEAYNKTRVTNTTRLHGWMKEVNPYAYHINEHLAGATEENEMAQDGQLNWANMTWNCENYAKGYNNNNNNQNRFHAEMGDQRLWGSTVSYMESHDEQRLAYYQLSGDESVSSSLAAMMHRLGSLAAQMIMTPGAHMLWQFQELGDDQNNKNGNDNNVDPKKVNWNALQDPDRKGLHDNYAELLQLRRANPDMFEKSATCAMQCGGSNWADGRYIVLKSGDKEILTYINPNTSGTLTMKAHFATSSQNNYQIVSKSYGTQPSFNASQQTVTIPAHSYVTIATVNVPVSGLDEVKAIVDDAATPCDVYDLHGRVVGLSMPRADVDKLAAGIYVVRQGDNAFKVTVR